MDMEEDTVILSLLSKHMPSCVIAADIEQLVKDIQCSRRWWFQSGQFRRL